MIARMLLKVGLVLVSVLVYSRGTNVANTPQLERDSLSSSRPCLRVPQRIRYVVRPVFQTSSRNEKKLSVYSTTLVTEVQTVQTGATSSLPPPHFQVDSGFAATYAIHHGAPITPPLQQWQPAIPHI